MIECKLLDVGLRRDACDIFYRRAVAMVKYHFISHGFSFHDYSGLLAMAASSAEMILLVSSSEIINGGDRMMLGLSLIHI